MLEWWAADYTASVNDTSNRRVKQPGWLADDRTQAIVGHFLWAVVFALAYAQAPLFTSNQNQYFLHALARAGFGQLGADWLANTLDPTPVFSALVWLTATTLGTWAFYLQYGLLMGIYLFSLLALARTVAADFGRQLPTVPFLGAMVVLHSAAFRYGLARLAGPDWEYLFEAGLAGQRLLGPVYQPSTFGVFLLAAIALFLRGRAFPAVACAALAAIVHPTYLLSAAVLTATMVALEWQRTQRFARPIGLGAAALLLVLPITLYTARLFAPSGPETWRQAAEVLIEFRIPHHTQLSQWLNATALVQLALLSLALALVRRSKLFVLLAVPAATALGLTIVQQVTGDLRLTLLMPWRLSAFLIPAASTVIVGIGLARWLPASANRTVTRLTWAVAGLAALAGVGAFVLLLQRQQQAPHQGVVAHVRANLEPGDNYLIPPDFQEFRLAARAPAFIDFKSIPYQDQQVLTWYDRVRRAQFFYRDDPGLVSCELLPTLYQMGAFSHVLLDDDLFGLECAGLALEYADDHYRLMRYHPPADG